MFGPLGDATQASETIHFYCDNTAVLFALQTGYSSSYHFNQHVIAIRKRLAQLDIALKMSYVPTADNPADALSRGGSVFTKNLRFSSWVEEGRAGLKLP